MGCSAWSKRRPEAHLLAPCWPPGPHRLIAAEAAAAALWCLPNRRLRCLALSRLLAAGTARRVFLTDCYEGVLANVQANVRATHAVCMPLHGALHSRALH